MKKNLQKKEGKWDISFAVITRYTILFCLLIIITVFIGGGVLSAGRMKTDAETSLVAGHARISQRVRGAVSLLESLAGLSEYYDPDIPPIEKVKKLDQMSPCFGYMMICYLSNLPVDIIKIDRSLTRQILSNPKQCALLKSIVNMASINGLSVVAEGVETQEEQQEIAESRVDYIQGYFYARPMPEEELCLFLSH